MQSTNVIHVIKGLLLYYFCMQTVYHAGDLQRFIATEKQRRLYKKCFVEMLCINHVCSIFVCVISLVATVILVLADPS